MKETIRRFLPRTKRSHTIWGGKLRGARIFTSWHDYPAAILGRTEAPLLEWLEQNVKLGETWLDVGAHYGYTAIALSKLVGSDGRVIAFEPMGTTFGCISETRRLNRVNQLQVVAMGLGSCESMQMRQLPVVRGMVDSTYSSADWNENLLVARFDWLWPQLTPSRLIHGIKIDVQGMELEVLQGMVECLRVHRPKLAIEFHSGVVRADVLQILSQIGYALPGTAIEPTSEEKDTPLYLNDRTYAFLAS